MQKIRDTNGEASTVSGTLLTDALLAWGKTSPTVHGDVLAQGWRPGVHHFGRPRTGGLHPGALPEGRAVILGPNGLSRRKMPPHRASAFLVSPLRFFLVFVLCFPLLLLGSRTVGADDLNPKRTKRALLIGINEYEVVRNLEGPVNDVRAMSNILRWTQFNFPEENIKILPDQDTGERADRQGIIRAIQTHLIDKTQKDDLIVLYYSGHGSQLKDVSGDEEDDGMDETIVPSDARTEGVCDITDDEINGLLRQLTEKTKYVTVIFDSCHSGTAIRTERGNPIKWVPPDPRTSCKPADFAVSTPGGEGPSDFAPWDSEYVFLAASGPDESAVDMPVNIEIGSRTKRMNYGALTWYLIESLNKIKSPRSYEEVLEEVKAKVKARYTKQTPLLEGSGKHLAIFGIERVIRSFALVDSTEGNKVLLSRGTLSGLGKGAILKVYPPGTTDFTQTSYVATVRVTDAEEFGAKAEIFQGEPVEVASRAVLEKASFSAVSVPVYVDALMSDSLDKIRKALADVDTVRLADSDRSARFLVEEADGKIIVRAGDLVVVAPPVLVTDRDYVEHVVNQVKDLVHWVTLLELRNPDPGIRIKFVVRLASDPVAPLPREVAHKSVLSVTLKNSEDRPLYIYLLDVSSDGSVVLLYPKKTNGEYAQLVLKPGEETKKRIGVGVPIGRDEVMDYLKVIATTSPIDPSVFPQGIVRRSTPEQRTEPHNNLSEFFESSSRTGGSEEPVQVDSWITDQKPVWIRRYQ